MHELQQAAAGQSKFIDSSKAPTALKPQDRKSLIAHQVIYLHGFVPNCLFGKVVEYDCLVHF